MESPTSTVLAKPVSKVVKTPRVLLSWLQRDRIRKGIIQSTSS